MSLTLKASCRPVAVMAACRPMAAGPARRVAPSAARLAPLRPASALKNASLTGLCSSFAGEKRRRNWETRVDLTRAPSLSFFFTAAVHDECKMRTRDVDRRTTKRLERVTFVGESRSFATTATAAAADSE